MKKFILISILFFALCNTINATLTTPGIVSPTNGATNQAPNVQLDWSSVTGATSYEFKLSTDPTLSGAIPQSSGSNSYYNISELFFGTTYYWQVRAKSATDSSNWSAIWHFTILDNVSLYLPTNGATGQMPDVILDWYPLDGITYYDYEYDTTITFNSPLHQYGSVASGTSQVITSNLRFGTKYYWRARARYAEDTTQWSAIWNFTTLDNVSLYLPTNGATGQMPDVILDWYPLDGITYYDYEYDTTTTFNSPLHQYGSIVSSTSQVTTSNLLFGTKYYWRARARHTTDTSQWSATWNFTTLDYFTLVSPTNGATGQMPDVTLDWDYVSGITYYDYEYDTTGTFNSPLHHDGSVSSSTSQVTTSNLLFGTKYYWRARARHTTDTSQWSATWNFTTLDYFTLVSPTNGATGQMPDVTLDWDYVSGITYYDYEYDTTGTFNSPLHHDGSVSSSTSQVTTSNLLFGTKYYWRARARHTTDTSQWSATWNFTTLDYLTHVSPTNGATNVSINPTIDWNGITGITEYRYRFSRYANFDTFTELSSGTTSQATLSNLFYGETYYWQVRACHSADTSEWSQPWHFTTAFQLTVAPNLINPNDNSTDIPLSGVTLEWSSVSGATFYEIKYDVNSSFINPITGQSPTLTYNTDILQNATTYYWKVRAGNGSGYSPWSAVWNFTTIQTAPNLISPPDNSVNNPITGTTLVWSSVSDAIFYEYEYDINSSFTNPVINTTTSLSATTGTLQFNTTYYWKVRAAFADFTYSPWSEVWSFTTETENMVNEIYKEGINIFPNPANDNLSILILDNSISLLNISLIDVNGKVIWMQNDVSQKIIYLDVRTFSNGQYFLKIEKLDKTKVFPVIIEH